MARSLVVAMVLVSLVPALASARQPLPRVLVVNEIAATSTVAGAEVWRAFDGDYATGWCAGQTAGNAEGLTITLATPTVVDEVTVMPASPASTGVTAPSFTASIEIAAGGPAVTLKTRPGALIGEMTARLGKRKVKQITIRFAGVTGAGPVCISEVMLYERSVAYTPVWDLPADQLAAAPAAVMATWDAFAGCGAKALSARVALPIEFTDVAKPAATPVVTRYTTADELARACRARGGIKPATPGEGNGILQTARYRYPGRELVFLATLTITTTMAWRFAWRGTSWQLVGIERHPTGPD